LRYPVHFPSEREGAAVVYSGNTNRALKSKNPKISPDFLNLYFLMFTRAILQEQTTLRPWEFLFYGVDPFADSIVSLTQRR